MRPRYLLFSTILIPLVVLLLLSTEAFALLQDSSQCALEFGFQSEEFEYFAGKKDQGGDLLHKIAQMMIDLWLQIVKYTIEFVCGIFRSLGFRCG